MKKVIALFLVVIPLSLSSQGLDYDILKAVHNPDPLTSDGFFRFVSDANFYVYCGTPVTLAIVGLATDNDDMLLDAAFMAVGTAVSYGITVGLKYTVRRDRPFIEFPGDFANKSGHDYTGSYSFPSGHSTTAFATATSLCLEYPRWYIIAPSCLYAGTLAYSRMNLGVHNPSDVLAGALIGSGCAVISHYVNKKLTGSPKRH